MARWTNPGLEKKKRENPVHYIPLSWLVRTWTLCEVQCPLFSDIRTTTDPSKATCKRCKQRIAKQAANAAEKERE
jgi:hypothetical protein